MNKMVLLVYLLPVFFTSELVAQNISEEIENIENGLIEFTTVDRVFQPDSIQLANPGKITERMEYYKVPGVSIAVIDNYRLKWVKVYGIRDAKTGDSITTETIFEAASTSKFITAVLVLYFVEIGLIDLDVDVNNYLRSWQVPESKYTQEEKVTVRRLLTHLGGMPTTNFDYDENLGIPRLVDVLNDNPPALNKAAIPEFIPGSKWQYSNIGYDVIQLLLEDITGKPFQQNADEIIFRPLGMSNSTFNYPLDSTNKKQEAMPHDSEGTSRKPIMHSTAVAHGGLTTTPTDLAKFTSEIMLSYQGKSGKIISHEMTKKLFNKEFNLDPNLYGLPLSEGLGIFLMGEGKNLTIMHPGNNVPGLNCWLIGWPERGTGAVIMTNGANGEILTLEIISAINIIYNRKDY